jgi:CHAD domain-containing protein
METTLTTTIVSASGAVITGIFAMFFTANQLGKRIDDMRVDIRELRAEFYAFKVAVNGKLSALDTEIAKLMDRRNPQ